MTYSMTAFASHKASCDFGVIQWDIRSLNHRHLDLHFMLPSSFSAVENQFREQIRSAIHRGRIDCHFSFIPAKSSLNFSLNEGLLAQLIAAHEHIDNRLPHTSALKAVDLLRWPGLLHITEVDIEAILPTALKTLTTTLEELVITRAREGENIVKTLQPKLTALINTLQEIKKYLPEILANQRHRLNKKLEEAKLNLDLQRVEQEIVILAHKIDVAEEIDRLTIHIQEVQRLLTTPGHHGRRLDFLMQEMNREANTLGAKTNESQIIHAAVEMKVIIEQMREQIQNIE